MNIFQGAVYYIREFDPKFTPIGANRQQIETLEALAGRPLPPVYADFLAVMGVSMDWLVIDAFDLHIRTVAEYYRENKWLSSTQYFRIGSATAQPLLHPHLEDGVHGELPEVISIPDYGPNSFDLAVRRRTPYAGSLDEMICMPVFEQFELRANDRKPIKVEARKRQEGALDRAQAALESYGFTTLWFSSPTGRAFRRDDAAIKAVQNYVHPLVIDIGADSQLMAESLALQVRKDLQL